MSALYNCVYARTVLYFVDESGIDLKEAPCSVLACVGVEEADVWPFAQAFLKLKEDVLRFPPTQPYEAKGTKLLTRRVFKLATAAPALSESDRAAAIDVLLEKNARGEDAGFEELVAIAQAKLVFVDKALDLADRFGMTIFASIVPRDAPQQRDGSFLRKDFAYLFQRIHCHVCERADHAHGVLIFDEQDKALSQGLLDQIHRYFEETDRGKQRAERMIPMPFFVHSELTPIIQLADVVAYIINWGLRMPRMPEVARAELKPLADKVFGLRYQGNEVPVVWRAQARKKRAWGIAYIEDLRPHGEKPQHDDALDLDESEGVDGMLGAAPSRA
ncbi:MAG TPA: DUF3800 domain-containing protein [Solirubrobacteraceae bacterium]|nr:DUF3800 domain-containing protein [Solirubrobacteraceae bacterium]